MDRRSFLRSSLAAPALVAAGNIMPISLLAFDDTRRLNAMLARGGVIDLGNSVWRVTHLSIVSQCASLYNGTVEFIPAPKPTFALMTAVNGALLDLKRVTIDTSKAQHQARYAASNLSAVWIANTSS